MINRDQMIENLNYYNDERVTARDGTKDVWVVLESGEEVKLPTHWQVCDLCGGKGTHVNPSIDSGGLSAEDFYDDPDFAEDYMAGHYDVPCNRCKGRTTIQAVDLDACTDEQKKAYQDQIRAEKELQAEIAAELAMGA